MPIIYRDIDELMAEVKLPVVAKRLPKWGNAIKDWNSWKKLDKYERFSSYQRKRMNESMKRVKMYPYRTRVTKTKLLNILENELKGRLLNYLHPNMKKRILCIVGESGVGKTLVSLHLKNKLGANTICSYTTRPPRDNEEEGRDHHFVDIVPPFDEILAYTLFGGYEYYATRAQVQGPCTVYVIDENGLRDFKERWQDEYEIFSLYLTRKKLNRKKLGIDKGRMERDEDRELFDLSFYDYVIANDGTKEELFKQVDDIYRHLSCGEKEQIGFRLS